MSGVLAESVRITRNILETAVKRGADRHALLAAAGLDPAQLENSEARVPSLAHRILLDEGARLSGDAALGIHAGEGLEADGADIIWYIFLNCPTLREAVAEAERYYKVISDVASPHLSITGSEITLQMSTTLDLPVWPPQGAEYTLAVWSTMCRKLVGKQDLFREVRFQHPEPPDTREHTWYFQAPVVFGQPRNELVLHPELLDAPNAFKTPDAHLLEMLLRHAETHRSLIARSSDFTSAVRRALAATLRKEGTPTLEVAAAEMGISGRTLQRRLTENGVSFSGLLEAMRRKFALVYLKESKATIYEIAFLLGYSSPEAFTRAFRRWEGASPLEIRDS